MLTGNSQSKRDRFKDNHDTNILRYRHGWEEKPDKSKRTKLLESLCVSTSVITCCDFGCDCE